MNTLDPKSALVLFSGGQDSSTCLAWALSRFERVETIGFRYGQKHAIELETREPLRQGLCDISDQWRRRLGPDHLVPLDVLSSLSASALTTDIPFGKRPDGLPATFVPGRNLLFLTLAAVVAYNHDLKHIVGGMCETDFSGYPDCRDDAIKALQAAINLGMETRVVIETPLMWIDKAATWALARELGGAGLIELIVERSHTCYVGDRSNKHAWGYGCGACDACNLRAKGWWRFQENVGGAMEPEPTLVSARVN